MRITKYRIEQDESRKNVLVKEKSSNYAADELCNPQKVVNMLNALFNLDRMAEEYVYLVAMDTRCKPIGVFEVSHGGVSLTVCSPREIYIRALLCGASGIILAHNHPSGDTCPSKQDMETFRIVKEAGEILGVGMYDNLIVGGNGAYFSFKENGLFG